MTMPVSEGIKTIDVNFVNFPQDVYKIIPKPFRIVHKDNDTFVHWTDGTVTRVSLCESETYSEFHAFCAALAKKIYGSTSAVKKAVYRL